MTDTRSAPQAEPEPSQQRLPRLQTAAIGLGAGVLNGLLGIGGGILIVPGMILLRGASPRVAVSTSLGAVLLLSVAALAVHLAISGLAFSLVGTVLLLAAGGLGAQAGGWLLLRISQRWILLLFAALAAFSAANLIAKALVPALSAPVAGAAPPLASFAAIGFTAGFFSGMLGIGGGGIVVLAFAVLFHTPILGGLPLALLVNVANAGSGVLAQRRSGNILWGEVARLVPAALAGIGLGAAAAVLLPPDALRVVFALFFLYVSYRLVRRGLRTPG